MTSCTSRALQYLFQVVVCNKRVLLFDEHSDWLHICFSRLSGKGTARRDWEWQLNLANSSSLHSNYIVVESDLS